MTWFYGKRVFDARGRMVHRLFVMQARTERPQRASRDLARHGLTNLFSIGRVNFLCHRAPAGRSSLVSATAAQCSMLCNSSRVVSSSSDVWTWPHATVGITTHDASIGYRPCSSYVIVCSNLRADREIGHCLPAARNGNASTAAFPGCGSVAGASGRGICMRAATRAPPRAARCAQHAAPAAASSPERIADCRLLSPAPLQSQFTMP